MGVFLPLPVKMEWEDDCLYYFLGRGQSPSVNHTSTPIDVVAGAAGEGGNKLEEMRIPICDATSVADPSQKNEVPPRRSMKKLHLVSPTSSCAVPKSDCHSNETVPFGLGAISAGAGANKRT
jgi:hypothetical protein